MAKKFNLSESQKLAVRAAYDKYKLSGCTKQQALEKTAAEWGVHWQTIRKVIQGTTTVDPKQLKDIKDQQASKIDSIVNSILGDLDGSEKVLKGLSPAQAALAICQLIDKSMKLKGEDVQKVEIHEVGEKVKKRLDELQNLREALKKSMTVPDKPEDN